VRHMGHAAPFGFASTCLSRHALSKLLPQHGSVTGSSSTCAVPPHRASAARAIQSLAGHQPPPRCTTDARPTAQGRAPPARPQQPFCALPHATRGGSQASAHIKGPTGCSLCPLWRARPPPAGVAAPHLVADVAAEVGVRGGLALALGAAARGLAAALHPAPLRSAHAFSPTSSSSGSGRGSGDPPQSLRLRGSTLPVSPGYSGLLSYFGGWLGLVPPLMGLAFTPRRRNLATSTGRRFTWAQTTETACTLSHPRGGGAQKWCLLTLSNLAIGLKPYPC